MRKIPFSTQIEPEVYEAIVRVAKRDCRSKNSLINRVLMDWAEKTAKQEAEVAK